MSTNVDFQSMFAAFQKQQSEQFQQLMSVLTQAQPVNPPAKTRKAKVETAKVVEKPHTVKSLLALNTDQRDALARSIGVKDLQGKAKEARPADFEKYRDRAICSYLAKALKEQGKTQAPADSRLADLTPTESQTQVTPPQKQGAKKSPAKVNQAQPNGVVILGVAVPAHLIQPDEKGYFSKAQKAGLAQAFAPKYASFEKSKAVTNLSHQVANEVRKIHPSLLNKAAFDGTAYARFNGNA